MRRLVFVLLLVFVLTPRLAHACPSCSEAVPANSGSEEADQVRLGRAYNNSIYLMAGMPYLLLGTVGYLVFRHLRIAPTAGQQGQAHSLTPREDHQSGLPGDRACSLPSPDDVS